MARNAPDATLDQMLDYIRDNVTELRVCAGEPTTRAEAVTNTLAVQTGLTTGDFTIANGSVSGRRVTVAQQSSISISATGTADHIALCDGSILYFVTTCTSQALTSGGTVTVPAWDIEIRDPAAP